VLLLEVVFGVEEQPTNNTAKEATTVNAMNFISTLGYQLSTGRQSLFANVF